MPRFSRIARLTHDWRFRTLAPVLVIHGCAFLGLYLLVQRLAMQLVLRAETRTSTYVLEEASEVYANQVPEHGPILAHGRRSITAHLARVSRQHGNAPIALYDGAGELLWSGGEVPGKWQQAQVAEALRTVPREIAWTSAGQGGLWLLGTRVLHNSDLCHRCHEGAGAAVGVVQLRQDLGPYLAEMMGWARGVLAVIAVAWIVLAVVTGAIKRLVIGRPLARIGEELQAVGPKSEEGRGGDLDTLAERLHDTISGLQERERARQEDVARQMARAEQMASLGTVAAGLSHEIKNPLAGIRTAVEVLARDVTDPERQGIYRQIVAELDRVVRTVENLLRLARPQRPARMPARLDQIVGNAATLFAPQLRSRSIDLDVAVKGEIGTLELDSNLIMQLLVNLITNADQAVGQGGRIGVSVAPLPNGEGAILAVEDDGPGIPTASLERVFDPFFTTKATGTGLGLPLCRQIVEQHGGSIKLESDPGKGTKVVVYLPAHVEMTAEVG